MHTQSTVRFACEVHSIRNENGIDSVRTGETHILMQKLILILAGLIFHGISEERPVVSRSGHSRPAGTHRIRPMSLCSGDAETKTASSRILANPERRNERTLNE